MQTAIAALAREGIVRPSESRSGSRNKNPPAGYPTRQELLRHEKSARVGKILHVRTYATITPQSILEQFKRLELKTLLPCDTIILLVTPGTVVQVGPLPHRGMVLVTPCPVAGFCYTGSSCCIVPSYGGFVNTKFDGNRRSVLVRAVSCGTSLNQLCRNTHRKLLRRFRPDLQPNRSRKPRNRGLGKPRLVRKPLTDYRNLAP